MKIVYVQYDTWLLLLFMYTVKQKQFENFCSDKNFLFPNWKLQKFQIKSLKVWKSCTIE